LDTKAQKAQACISCCQSHKIDHHLPSTEEWIRGDAQEEKFQLPVEVRERLEAYAARFFVLKTPRKLLWKPDLGAVDLCLTVGDQTLELSVTPIQATIIMHFKARPR